jgi:hypothetical protein
MTDLGQTTGVGSSSSSTDSKNEERWRHQAEATRRRLERLRARELSTTAAAAAVVVEGEVEEGEAGAAQGAHAPPPTTSSGNGLDPSAGGMRKPAWLTRVAASNSGVSSSSGAAVPQAHLPAATSAAGHAAAAAATSPAAQATYGGVLAEQNRSTPGVTSVTSGSGVVEDVPGSTVLSMGSVQMPALNAVRLLLSYGWQLLWDAERGNGRLMNGMISHHRAKAPAGQAEIQVGRGPWWVWIVR